MRNFKHFAQLNSQMANCDWNWIEIQYLKWTELINTEVKIKFCQHVTYFLQLCHICMDMWDECGELYHLTKLRNQKVDSHWFIELSWLTYTNQQWHIAYQFHSRSGVIMWFCKAPFSLLKRKILLWFRDLCNYLNDMIISIILIDKLLFNEMPE